MCPKRPFQPGVRGAWWYTQCCNAEDRFQATRPRHANEGWWWCRSRGAPCCGCDQRNQKRPGEDHDQERLRIMISRAKDGVPAGTVMRSSARHTCIHAGTGLTLAAHAGWWVAKLVGHSSCSTRMVVGCKAGGIQTIAAGGGAPSRRVRNNPRRTIHLQPKVPGGGR